MNMVKPLQDIKKQLKQDLEELKDYYRASVQSLLMQNRFESAEDVMETLSQIHDFEQRFC